MLERRLVVVLTCWMSLLMPGPTQAQQDPGSEDGGEPATPKPAFIFQFTDDTGELHFVDDITLVPPQYRGEDLVRISIEPPADADLDDLDDITMMGTPSSRPQDPPPSSRVVSGSEREAREAKQTEQARRQRDSDRLTELRQRRDELQRRLALIEEGFADDERDEPLTDEETERLMVQSLEALDRINREIAALDD